MDRISRRQVVRGAAAMAGAMTLGAPSVSAQNDRQTLRFVAQADLKNLTDIDSSLSIGIHDAAAVGHKPASKADRSC
jgi:hypothetical protein